MSALKRAVGTGAVLRTCACRVRAAMAAQDAEVRRRVAIYDARVCACEEEAASGAWA